MPAVIRKTLLHVETTLIEGGKAAPVPLKLIAAAAVVKNPWAGMGFVENLKPAIHDVAPDLGALLTAMILEAIQAHYRQGKRGLAPKEIRDEIAKMYWPEVTTEAVGPIAWRMMKRGELDKTPDELYTLPKDKAPAHDAEASFSTLAQILAASRNT